MEDHRATDSQTQTRRSASEIREAGGAQRRPVCAAHRVCVARVAARPAAVGHGVWILPALDQGGSVGMDWRAAARRSTTEGREKKAPTAAILDSQSVKTAVKCAPCGYHANKHIKAPNHHPLTTTLSSL